MKNTRLIRMVSPSCRGPRLPDQIRRELLRAIDLPLPRTEPGSLTIALRTETISSRSLSPRMKRWTSPKVASCKKAFPSGCSGKGFHVAIHDKNEESKHLPPAAPKQIPRTTICPARVLPGQTMVAHKPTLATLNALAQLRALASRIATALHLPPPAEHCLHLNDAMSELSTAESSPSNLIEELKLPNNGAISGVALIRRLRALERRKQPNTHLHKLALTLKACKADSSDEEKDSPRHCQSPDDYTFAMNMERLAYGQIIK